MTVDRYQLARMKNSRLVLPKDGEVDEYGKPLQPEPEDEYELEYKARICAAIVKARNPGIPDNLVVPAAAKLMNHSRAILEKILYETRPPTESGWTWTDKET